jgi:acetylornithine deacetylase
VPWHGTLVFESVIEEERTGNGTLAARLRDSLPIDAAIIPEITSEEIHAANLGVLWAELRVDGLSSYVGRAGESVNAVSVGMELARRVESLAHSLNDGFNNPLYAFARAPMTVNIGSFHGGDWPSAVPTDCSIGIRMSFPPDWPVDRAKELLEETISSAGEEIPWLREHPPRIRYHGFVAEGWQIDEQSSLLGVLKDSYEDEYQRDPTVVGALGTADARYFGDAGVDALYFGPSGGGMHGPDEYVDLDSVQRVARVFARAILRYCGADG